MLSFTLTWARLLVWFKAEICLHIVYTTVLQRQTHREIPTSSKLRPSASRVTKTIATRFSYLQELKGPGSELDSCFQRCSCREIWCGFILPICRISSNIVQTHSTWCGFSVDVFRNLFPLLTYKIDPWASSSLIIPLSQNQVSESYGDKNTLMPVQLLFTWFTSIFTNYVDFT